MQRSIPALIFVFFFAFYSWQKYAAAAPPSFQQAYAINVAILVTLTALLPYIIARILVARIKGSAQLVSALIAPLVLCAVGFTIFFFVFIQPNFAQATLGPVVQRSITPGLAIGGILVLSLLLKRRVA